MKLPNLCRVGVCALLVALTTIGCAPVRHVRAASAGAAAETRIAAQFAATGMRVMREREQARSILTAEQAVAARPRDANDRARLGQVYLQAGRFASAAKAYQDAATLAPEDGRILLGMALADGAMDRADAARGAIAAARVHMPAADCGLALALIGDGADAVGTLEAAARAAAATRRTRQNLALAYALTGRWDAARATAAQDLPPTALDARLSKWAMLARAQSRKERIAAFLGVSPAADDAGMPATLALADRPVPAPPVMSAAVREADVFTGGRVVAGYVVPVMAPAPRAHGSWVVQLGAFFGDRSTQAAWDQIRQSIRPVAAMTPLSSTVRLNGRQFQRLAVGGLASRSAATALCAQVQRHHGACFVRKGGDEAPLRMARAERPMRLAAR